MGEATGKPSRQQPRTRRARRSSRVSAALDAARQRNNEQLVEQRRKENEIDQALRDYFDAAGAIIAAEETFARKIKPYEDAIARLRATEHAMRNDAQSAQAKAALTIHDAGRTVAEVGELLGIGEKAARKLIADGRDAEESRDSPQALQHEPEPTLHTIIAEPKNNTD